MASYAALIARESDYRIAVANQLLPAEISWPDWCRLVQELLSCPSETVGKADIYTHVADRFVYGELRLHRLNLIYLCLGYTSRGYLPQWNTYNDFLRQNVTVVFAGSAYTVIVLSAMQVGLGTAQLMNSADFQAVSYGFVVFAMIAPLAGLCAVLIALCIGFVVNWRWSSQREQRREHELKRSWRKKRSKWLTLSPKGEAR